MHQALKAGGGQLASRGPGGPHPCFKASEKRTHGAFSLAGPDELWTNAYTAACSITSHRRAATPRAPMQFTDRAGAGPGPTSSCGSSSGTGPDGGSSPGPSSCGVHVRSGEDSAAPP